MTCISTSMYINVNSQNDMEYLGHLLQTCTTTLISCKPMFTSWHLSWSINKLVSLWEIKFGMEVIKFQLPKRLQFFSKWMSLKHLLPFSSFPRAGWWGAAGYITLTTDIRGIALIPIPGFKIARGIFQEVPLFTISLMLQITPNNCHSRFAKSYFKFPYNFASLSVFSFSFFWCICCGRHRIIPSAWTIISWELISSSSQFQFVPWDSTQVQVYI